VYNIFCYPIFRQHKQTLWPKSTYNCPCETHDVLKSKLQKAIVWPWDLLIVIATNANLIENWRRLKCIGTSVGITGIRGNNIFSPRNLPFKMMASIIFFINFLMTNRMPLHNHGGFKKRSKITGDPTFSCKLCGYFALYLYIHVDHELLTKLATS
jgi:hypothetical protein